MKILKKWAIEFTAIATAVIDTAGCGANTTVLKEKVVERGERGGIEPLGDEYASRGLYTVY